MRKRALVLALALLVLVGAAPAVRSVEPDKCPSTIDPQSFTSEQTLREWNEVMADLGPRPTASPAHEHYIRWVEKHLADIPGIEISELTEVIDRQLETSTSLSVGSSNVAVAGAVPYTQPVPSGVTAPLVYVPTGTAIADADVKGKIVVRDAPAGSIPMAAFFAVAWFLHDPGFTFSYTGNYERDWIGAATRVTDLTQAQEAEAAGLLFIHGLPKEQVQGQYVPYTGHHWKVPALYLGVDEGTALKKQIEATGDAPIEATLKLSASQHEAPTRTLIGTLPGQSEERIVIESHTDGMNAVWDNGPVSILALAEYFAALPKECRPRTIEFVFTTAHLYLTHAGAHRYAKVLDHDYDQGSVALVVALEHLGAKEFLAVPREGDLPGRKLESSGKSELFATFSMESPILVKTVTEQIVAHDLRRRWLLRGADAPRIGFPPHRSFGGEGGPYRECLVPTVAAITGPWTLFDPAFEMDELIDFDLMRRQTLAFGDVVLAVDDVPRQVIAGADNVYRPGRDITGSDDCGHEGHP